MVLHLYLELMIHIMMWESYKRGAIPLKGKPKESKKNHKKKTCYCCIVCVCKSKRNESLQFPASCVSNGKGYL